MQSLNSVHQLKTNLLRILKHLLDHVFKLLLVLPRLLRLVLRQHAKQQLFVRTVLGDDCLVEGLCNNQYLLRMLVMIYMVF